MYYATLGDNETALRLLQSLPAPTANDLEAIATAEAQLHREAEAETAYGKAIAASTDPGQWRIHAAILNNFGILLHRLGKLGEARNDVEQGLAVSQSHQDWGGSAAALSELAEIAADENDAAAAGEKAEEGLRMARQSGAPVIITSALVAQARALEVSGRGEEAEQTFLQAISMAEDQRADAPASAAGLQGEVDGWRPAYQYAVRHDIRSGKALAALRLADRAKARVLLDMIDGGEPGFDAIADPRDKQYNA